MVPILTITPAKTTTSEKKVDDDFKDHLNSIITRKGSIDANISPPSHMKGLAKEFSHIHKIISSPKAINHEFLLCNSLRTESNEKNDTSPISLDKGFDDFFGPITSKKRSSPKTIESALKHAKNTLNEMTADNFDSDVE